MVWEVSIVLSGCFLLTLEWTLTLGDPRKAALLIKAWEFRLFLIFRFCSTI